MQPAILILLHQGFSFADDLIDLNQKLGFQSIILTSSIRSDNAARVQALSNRAAEFRQVDQPALQKSDVMKFIDDLDQKSIRPLACLTVWEGYREHMATANLSLGATDESPNSIAGLTDKFILRNRLNQLGLSQIKTRIVDSNLQSEGRPLFIKPRSGLGSFGAFKWNGENLSEKLQQLSAQMHSDSDYAGVFSATPNFVAEDEIVGPEFSFEVISQSGLHSILAVHEKLDLQAAHGSILENACVSPPLQVPQAIVNKGVIFVDHVLTKLGIRTGCYHIEARWCDNSRWEIIEINPRIGGAFITQSTRWVSGSCQIRLWLESLISKKTWVNLGLERKIDRLPLQPVIKGKSFFRVYFGDPGRHVDKLMIKADGPQPSLFKQIVKEGTTLPQSDREIFLAQALWLLEDKSEATSISNLNEISKTYLQVTYAS